MNTPRTKSLSRATWWMVALCLTATLRARADSDEVVLPHGALAAIEAAGELGIEPPTIVDAIPGAVSPGTARRRSELASADAAGTIAPAGLSPTGRTGLIVQALAKEDAALLEKAERIIERMERGQMVPRPAYESARAVLSRLSGLRQEAATESERAAQAALEQRFTGLLDRPAQAVRPAIADGDDRPVVIGTYFATGATDRARLTGSRLPARDAVDTGLRVYAARLMDRVALRSAR